MNVRRVVLCPDDPKPLRRGGRTYALDPEKRAEVRRKYAEGKTVAQLAREFGVSFWTARNYVKGGAA